MGGASGGVCLTARGLCPPPPPSRSVDGWIRLWRQRARRPGRCFKRSLSSRWWRVALSPKGERWRCRQARRPRSRRLIPADLLLRLLPAFHSALSVLLLRGSVLAAATIAHNEPLFWLHAVERSLVKHLSSSPESHPAISTRLYLPCVASVQLPAVFRALRLPSRMFWESFLARRLSEWTERRHSRLLPGTAQ